MFIYGRIPRFNETANNRHFAKQFLRFYFIEEKFKRKWGGVPEKRMSNFSRMIKNYTIVCIIKKVQNRVSEQLDNFCSN